MVLIVYTFDDDIAYLVLTTSYTGASMKCKSSGFTLIELMITIAIIAILAGIAIPSYQNYILKSRRADGKAAVLAVQLKEEKWRANNVSYTSTLADLLMPTTSSDGYYTVAISDNTDTAYTITATHTGVQTADKDCKTLMIDEEGTKTATNSSNAPNDLCWGQSN